MNNFKILLKNNLLEFRRTKKWIIFISVFAILSILSSVLAKLLSTAFTPIFEMMGIQYEASIADAYTQFVANIAETGYLLVSIIFSLSLVKEKTSSTYYTLKSNGVKESEMVLAHFVSKLILLTVSYLIGVIVFVISNLILFNSYTGYRGALCLLLVYLFIVFSLCFSLFVSSVIKKKSLGIVISIVSYFIFSILYVIPKVGPFTPFYGMTLVNDIMYDNYLVNDVVINIAMLVALSIACIVSGIFLFKNKINNGKNNG